MTRFCRHVLASFLIFAFAATAVASQASAAWEIQGFDGGVLDSAGNTQTQAGSSPFTASTTISFPLVTRPNGTKFPAQFPRNLEIELPAGLVGNPQAAPTCTAAELVGGVNQDACPINAQIGWVRLDQQLGTANPVPGYPALYNMPAPAGVAAVFGFNYQGNGVTVTAKVRTGTDYGITTTSSGIPQTIPLAGLQINIWGTPADPGHDSDRGKAGGASLTGTPCSNPSQPPTCSNPSTAPDVPFLRLPTSCVGPVSTNLTIDTWEGAFDSASFLSHDTATPPNPVGADGCDRVPFDPSFSATPGARGSGDPTALDFDLSIPQDGLEEPNAISSSDLKKAVVRLPQGLAVNPAAADGLGACTPAEIALDTPEPATCPEDSKVGTVTVHTPLLDHPIEGAVYLAQQGSFEGALIALYIAADDARSGVVLKLPGTAATDPDTGQMTVTFDNQPQLPFTSLDLHFKSGNRATLTTPQTCGIYTTKAEFTGWSGAVADRTNQFTIDQGPGGGSCLAGDPAQAADPAALAARPFSPQFSAGTVAPVAGQHSPFVLRVQRRDGTQEFTSISADLPPGLLGTLTGVAECSDVALASIPTALDSGRAEAVNPACPASSLVGHVRVGVGSGPTPYYIPGNVYLAGPYKGAPLSLAIVTPAIAGPFDLGSVVVRTALYVDADDAQLHAVSDPVPTILDGIPLDVRDIRVSIDRPDFTLNPTNCNLMQVSGSVSGAGGLLNNGSDNTVAPVSDRFQVGGCQALPFSPQLRLSVLGKTNRNSKPRLKAVLTARPGEANIRRAQVNLPHSEFLEQSHIKTVCTRIEFAAGNGNGSACPQGSIYGRAKAWTPLLDHPLEGYVYLRSNGGERKLPDLVAALNGQVNIALWGKVDTGKNQGIRNTFEVVPDAPVSRFVLEMNGGKKGLLVNSEDLCRAQKSKRRAIVRLTGQNGEVDQYKPLVTNQCGKEARTGTKHHVRHHHRGR